MQLSVTLTENRSDPKRFVAITRYERRGDKLVKVRRVFDGPNHVASIKEMPYTTDPDRDYWTRMYSGERGEGGKGQHSRLYTIKRDWLLLHTELEYRRAQEVV